MSFKKENELIEMPVSYGENYTELVKGGEGITVDKGVINASGGSGGGGMFTVNITFVTPTEGSPYAKLDKTYNQITEAVQNGLLVVFKLEISEGELAGITYTYLQAVSLPESESYWVNDGTGTQYASASPDGELIANL